MIEMGPIISKIKQYALDIQASLAPWTQDRAEKLDSLDNLDVPVSSRADQEVADNIYLNIGSPASRNLTTVMGRLGSIVGYGEQKVYDTPGTYSWTVPDGVTKVTATIVSAGGGGGGGCSGIRNVTLTTKANAKPIYGDYPDNAVGEMATGSAGGTGAMLQIEKDVTPGETIDVVVGAGGAGGVGGSVVAPSNAGHGSTGGSSSFAGFACTGGGGGAGGKADFYTTTNNPQVKTSGGGAGGKALETTNAEVKGFKDGSTGGRSQGWGFLVTPLRFTKNREYVRFYPATDGVSTVDVRDKDGSFAKTSFTIPYFNVTKPTIPGPRLNWSTDYMDVGKAGDGGPTGDMGNIKLGAVSMGANHHDTVVTVDSSGTGGIAGTKGGDGIVIINY